MGADDEFPTSAPTQEPIAQSTQIVYMLIYFAVMFSCIGCAVCMSRSCNCCKVCLQQTLGCKCCEDVCCKKKKKGDIGKNDSWFLWIFSWANPCGAPGSKLFTFQRQLFLLCWKRVTENSRNTAATVLYFALPGASIIVFFVLYGSFSGFDNFDSSGIIETFATPLMFIIAVQMTSVSIVTEKSSRLQESMRMMGMQELPYWLSYIVVDAGLQGFAVSLFLSIVSQIFSMYHNNGAGQHGNGDGSFIDLFAILYFSVFALTTMAFAIAAIFDNPQTAGMFSFFLMFGDVVLFFVLIFSAPDLFDTATKQQLWCLFPPLALQLGIMNKFNCGCGLFLFTGDGKLEFGTILGMLVLDSVIYSCLAWYLGQVVPSEYGVRQPFYFLFKPSYWLETTHIERNARTETITLNQENPMGGNLQDENVSYACEKVGSSLGAPTVKVHNLKKSFGSFKAVNGISFEMYEGQIFSLLGHNGAGKTTTINMLTGLFPPDASSGDCSLYGSSVKNEMSNARRVLGICPQHDVLFDNLTTREHIIFFALLKGGAATWFEASEEADKLLEHFHMQERAGHIGAELSGGMKRKVSTAVALCGKSKFVILDEPTAGMDPLARRELWDLLKDMRKGRTMLLTTHYMDEADVLGDRIGIMSRGEIQCLGSSSFLKHEFGAGYKVICTMRHGALASPGGGVTASRIGSADGMKNSSGVF